MKPRTTKTGTLNDWTEVFVNILEKFNEVLGNHCHRNFFCENSPVNLNK